MTALAIGVES